MKTNFVGIGILAALIFGMLFSTVSAYVPTVPYDAVDYPERVISSRIRDYNPPGYYTKEDIAGRERMTYNEFCVMELEKFEALLGYDRAHTRI